MTAYFFTATESAHNQITKLYDFVWPTAAAMWNLRWQVAGYVKAVPNATVEQLRARFTEGADIHGANLQRACIEHGWDEQKDAFARILLINTIAIYEGWLDEVLDTMGKNTKFLQTGLQFPESVLVPGKGVRSAIAEITAVESNILRGSFFSELCKGRHYASSKLDAMMLCYRLFKEIRNSDMHGGGVAEQRLVDAYAQFSTVATTADLGVSEVPVHFPTAIGTKAKLSLRGVVGFSHIVLKIIATLDAELSRSESAEKYFIRKWKLTHPYRLSLSSGSAKRENKVKQFVKKAGFPKPAKPEALGDWLKQKALVFF
ncbi:MAG: hypothetical protein JWR26_190 [Pedosphaera sp.]|nr:hypothetical protein [Pedosphaera sp.]